MYVRIKRYLVGNNGKEDKCDYANTTNNTIVLIYIQ